MKKTAWLLSLVLFWCVVTGPGRAQGAARLEIRAFPEKPPALVWIDSVEMHATPLNLPDFRRGVHEVRVARKGVALKRRVLLKPGSHVILVADFLKNDILAKNRDSLDYEPMQGQTMLTFTSFSNTPMPRMKKKKAEPEKASSPEEKGGNTHATSAGNHEETAGRQKDEPGSLKKAKKRSDKKELSLAPPSSSGQNYYGPPVPERYREGPEEEKKESADAKDGEQKKEEPDKEKKKPEKDAEKKSQPPEQKKQAPAYPHPCPPSGNVDCSQWDASTIRGAVYNYYCLLSQNDFNEAYNYWLTDRSKGWFYGAAQKFCTIREFDIRGFEAVREPETTARAKYHVDLMERDGSVIETWKMETSLKKEGDIWMISSTRGKPAK